MLWMKRFVQEVGLRGGDDEILCDSESAIHLCKNSSFHSRSKHIDVRYHWVRDVFDDGQLSIGKVRSNDNGSDMLTKVLPKGKLEACCDIASLTNFTPTRS
ncbi:hypothetical protein Nepgr_005960 [Nepenthes gracilis]|uniref:Retrovirus-related Pol polyprotein from transposon TNT 1-94 n=1 Tax=Nepenthes gracilis TaxID=150966 RepID=A0AAD3S4D3_NEPGR|nr:hypothetical protein Nepgr_005960 [Nepenthes gracilis]